MTFAHFLIALCCYLNVHSIYVHKETRRLIDDTTGHLTADEKTDIVAYHNAKRAVLSTEESLKLKNDIYAPKSVPALNPLIWSDELEYVAKYLMDDCWYGHRPELRSDAWSAITGSTSEGPGENIGTNSFGPGADGFGPVQMILDLWWNEHTKYVWSEHTRGDPNFPKTGHFMQMISQRTTHIGCASRYCPNGVYHHGILREEFKFMLYCNYYPSGNLVGYFPYNNEVLPPPKSFHDVKQIQSKNGIGPVQIQHLFSTLETEGRKPYSFHTCELIAKGNSFRCKILSTVRRNFFGTEHFQKFLKDNYGWQLHRITVLKAKTKYWQVIGELKGIGAMTVSKGKLHALGTSSASGTKSSGARGGRLKEKTGSFKAIGVKTEPSPGSGRKRGKPLPAFKTSPGPRRKRGKPLPALKTSSGSGTKPIKTSSGSGTKPIKTSSGSGTKRGKPLHALKTSPGPGRKRGKSLPALKTSSGSGTKPIKTSSGPGRKGDKPLPALPALETSSGSGTKRVKTASKVIPTSRQTGARFKAKRRRAEARMIDANTASYYDTDNLVPNWIITADKRVGGVVKDKAKNKVKYWRKKQ